ncbi:uncharacterized protein BDD43_5590 [Mucilaginibacter gracilis]|uniref:TPM domain-containing protein n=1 Tax=Mucilaginibacter gracilis TaxID=423350 RepID=A0A495J9G1_9SPHI|nr:TPM domain-containing protein [Mucilaginibacter gracilis]RKR85321.1 uncharacterized protein BDD43_5590 [Mucilaginibacter gracilis]
MLKKLTLIFLLAVSACLAYAQDLPPKSTTLVTDQTNTLSPDEKARLESKLVAFDDSTSTQIAVVILKSVGSYDINQYGAALIRAWGIGTKGKNNGILILVAMADHKVSIQTGYGAEGAVPDIVTHEIITNSITPNFKQNKYYEGLDEATSSLIAHMKGEYKADAKTKKQVNNNDGGGGASIAIVIIIVVVVLVFIFRNRGGGGGHIIGRRGGASPFWWFLMGSAMGNSNSGGGFFGGGNNSGGGGSDSGGGFGGFGGGDSGGGGSSGSW